MRILYLGAILPWLAVIACSGGDDDREILAPRTTQTERTPTHIVTDSPGSTTSTDSGIDAGLTVTLREMPRVALLGSVIVSGEVTNENRFPVIVDHLGVVSLDASGAPIPGFEDKAANVCREVIPPRESSPFSVHFTSATGSALPAGFARFDFIVQGREWRFDTTEVLRVSGVAEELGDPGVGGISELRSYTLKGELTNISETTIPFPGACISAYSADGTILSAGGDLAPLAGGDVLEPGETVSFAYQDFIDADSVVASYSVWPSDARVLRGATPR